MVNFVQTSTRLKKLQKLALSSVNYRLIRRYVGSTPISILDYGCGAGDTLAAFAKFFKAAELWGCDVEVSYIEYTRSRVPASVKFFDLSSDVVQEEPELGSLDVVCCLQVIEHMASPEELYVRARKYLAPNGILVISTPNESGWAARMQRDKWHGYNDEEHINVYTKTRLESEVQRSGFEIIFSGSSWFSGFAIVRNSPLRILNDICYLLFGYRSWQVGDSVVVVAKPIN